jgi:hypothetical protein
MINHLFIFTLEEGNHLIRLILAYFASDYILQHKLRIDNKKWISRKMLIHVAVVFATTLLFSQLISISIPIAILFWLINTIKIQLLKSKPNWERSLFFIDKIIHLIIIVAIWTWHYEVGVKLREAIQFPFLNYKFSLIILAYVIVMYPVGNIIKYLTANISPTKSNKSVKEKSDTAEIIDGGKLIGQFERLIILTFVLLNQYEAIGFLITGKGIIRFAEKDENLRSEYILVGTMMSYALAILTGVLTNVLINF